MNILFISPSIPSTLHRIRTFSIIKALVKKHKVHLVSLDTSVESGRIVDELALGLASCKIIRKSKWKSLLDCALFLFSSQPLEVAYCRSAEMNKEIQKIIFENKIDLIYIKRLRSFQFVPISVKHVPMIIDTTDAMSLFYKRASGSVPWYKKPVFFEEYIKYLWYEKKVASQKGFNIKKWVTCSSVDADYLRNVSKIKDIEVVPNIVDTEYYNPGNLDNKAGNYSEEKGSIMISGLMDKFVNTEAVDFLVEEVLPIVEKSYPAVKLYIVGPKPTRHIKSYQNDQIIVTGYVKDLREYIMKAEVVVCTVKTGTGTRFKILQALAMKKPVVSTRAGFEGLSGEDGKEILLADDADSFAEKIVRLFADNDLERRLGSTGRELVVSKYSEKALSDSLEMVIKRL